MATIMGIESVMISRVYLSERGRPETLLNFSPNIRFPTFCNIW